MLGSRGRELHPDHPGEPSNAANMRGAERDVSATTATSGANASARCSSIARNWLGPCIPTAKLRTSQCAGARASVQRRSSTAWKAFPATRAGEGTAGSSEIRRICLK